MESVPCKIYGSQFANEIKCGKRFHIPVFSYKTFSSLKLSLVVIIGTLQKSFILFYKPLSCG